MQGYRAWKEARKRMLDPREQAPWHHSGRNEIDADDWRYDSYDMGDEEDSYDYSQHMVGNTAAQRQVDLAKSAAPPVLVDEDEWLDCDDEDESEVAQWRASSSVRQSSWKVPLMDLVVQESAKRRRRQLQREHSTNEAQELLQQLLEAGFSNEDLASSRVSTLRHLVEVVADRTKFDPAAYEERWRRAAEEDDDDDDEGGMGQRQLTDSAAPPPEACSKAVSLLPCEVWSLVGQFFPTLLSAVRLGSTCSYFRDMLEDTECYRELWARTEILCRCGLVKFYSSRKSILPPRSYRWSWHLSVRREVLVECLKSPVDTVSLNEISETLRRWDAKAWFQLYLQTTNPVAEQFAHFQTNRYLGMANIALQQAESFFATHDCIAEFVRKTLRIPVGADSIREFLSPMRMESLSSDAGLEFDAALEAKEAVASHNRSDDGGLHYGEVELHSVEPRRKAVLDTMNNYETFPTPARGASRPKAGRQRHQSHPTLKRATPAQNRLHRHEINMFGSADPYDRPVCLCLHRYRVRRMKMYDTVFDEPKPRKPGCLSKNRKHVWRRLW